MEVARNEGAPGDVRVLRRVTSFSEQKDLLMGRRRVGIHACSASPRIHALRPNADLSVQEVTLRLPHPDTPGRQRPRFSALSLKTCHKKQEVLSHREHRDHGEELF